MAVTHRVRPNKKLRVPAHTPSVISRQRLRKILINNASFILPEPEIFDTFFWFLAERHRIHCLRVAGLSPPWTEDQILVEFAFTNIFRVFDRVTQYVLRNVVKRGPGNLEDDVFRVLLFRTFNSIDTWEMLEEELGEISWRSFDLAKYERVLRKGAQGGALYGHAYIIPATDLGGPQGRNYENHLRLIKLMMDQDLPKELQRFEYLRDAHGYICLYPMIGSFTGFQYLLDLNLLPHFDWDEHQWAAIGPGSKSGLEKMFGSSVRGNEESAMEYLHGSLHSHFTRLGIIGDNVPRLCDERPSGLSMVDIEHAVCEYDKYCRARFPQLKGRRTEIKKRFTPKPADTKPYTADLPDKWRRPPSARNIPKPPAVRQAENGEEVFEVSHIVAERDRTDKNTTAKTSTKRFLVRWKGWGPEDDWWMSEHDLKEAQDLLKTWNTIKYGIQEGIERVRRNPYDKTVTASQQSRRRSTKF